MYHSDSHFDRYQRARERGVHISHYQHSGGPLSLEAQYAVTARALHIRWANTDVYRVPHISWGKESSRMK